MPREPKPLPYFTSQKQAAAHHKVDVEVIRQACAEDPSITRAAGRIDIERLAAWLKDWEWKKKQPPPDEDAGDSTDLVEIKRQRELVALKREALKLDKERDSLLPVAEFETALGATVQAFLIAINQVPGRAAQKIVARARVAAIDMLRGVLTPKQFEKIEPLLDVAAIEYGEIQELINQEIEHARQTLAQCQFLEAPPAAPPAETAEEAKPAKKTPTPKKTR